MQELIKDKGLIERIGGRLFLADKGLQAEEAALLPFGQSYVLAGNGLLAVTRTENYLIVAQAEALGLELDEAKPGFKWTGKPVDSATAAFLDNLFYSVWTKYGTEATTLLYLHNKANCWVVRVPTQKVGPASAKWSEGESWWYVKGERIMPPNQDDLTLVGTAHSHGGMKAFASGTDDKDDIDVPGLHLVFGSYNKDIFSRVSGGGVLSQVEVKDVIDLVGGRTLIEVPSVITKATSTISSWPTSYTRCGNGWENQDHYGLVSQEAHQSTAPAQPATQGEVDDCPDPDEFEWMNDLLEEITDPSIVKALDDASTQDEDLYMELLDALADDRAGWIGTTESWNKHLSLEFPQFLAEVKESLYGTPKKGGAKCK